MLTSVIMLSYGIQRVILYIIEKIYVINTIILYYGRKHANMIGSLHDHYFIDKKSRCKNKLAKNLVGKKNCHFLIQIFSTNHIHMFELKFKKLWFHFHFMKQQNCPKVFFE